MAIRLQYVDMWNGFPGESILDWYLKRWFDVCIVTDNPDFVICGPTGHHALDFECPRIFWTGECCTPDFNLYDYALGFDDISFGDRYLRLPLWLGYSTACKFAAEKHLIPDATLLRKKKFCNFVVSNGKGAKERTNFFLLLNEYKKVDSGGRYLNNIGGVVQDKLEFQRDYKFSIAFENGSYDGYITEKIIEAFAAGTIPIYWGAKDIAKEFNPDSFINVNDYPSFEDAVAYIEKVDADDALFIKIMHEPVFTEKSRGYTSYIKDDGLCIMHFFESIFSSGNLLRRNVAYFGKNYEYEIKKNCAKLSFLIPSNLTDNFQNIIIVGAGEVGQSYKLLMENTLGKNVVCIADNAKADGNTVVSVEKAVSDVAYDGIVLAVKSQKNAEALRTQLSGLGVPADKILWKPPVALC